MTEREIKDIEREIKDIEREIKDIEREIKALLRKHFTELTDLGLRANEDGLPFEEFKRLCSALCSAAAAPEAQAAETKADRMH